VRKLLTLHDTKEDLNSITKSFKSSFATIPNNALTAKNIADKQEKLKYEQRLHNQRLLISKLSDTQRRVLYNATFLNPVVSSTMAYTLNTHNIAHVSGKLTSEQLDKLLDTPLSAQQLDVLLKRL